MKKFEAKTYIEQLKPFEKVLWKTHIELKTKKPTVFSISGTSGTGKSTLAKNIKNYLKKTYKHSRITIKESGKIYRKIAEESGFRNKLIEFSKTVSSKNKDIDVLIDKKMLSFAYNLEYKKENEFKKLSYDYIIAVGRLANLVMGKNSILRIFLLANIDEIARRISKDKKREEYSLPIEEIRKLIMKRDKEDVKRYKRIYGIENYMLVSMSKSNVIIDTTRMSKKDVAITAIRYIELVIRGEKLNEVGMNNAKLMIKNYRRSKTF